MRSCTYCLKFQSVYFFCYLIQIYVCNVPQLKSDFLNLSEISCQIHICDGTDSDRTCFLAEPVIILNLYLVKVFSF
jgi:hypothetical protein